MPGLMHKTFNGKALYRSLTHIYLICLLSRPSSLWYQCKVENQAQLLHMSLCYMCLLQFSFLFSLLLPVSSPFFCFHSSLVGESNLKPPLTLGPSLLLYQSNFCFFVSNSHFIFHTQICEIFLCS